MVGFNAILMSEHFGAFFAFAVLHAALAIRYIKVQPFSCQRLTTVLQHLGINTLHAGDPCLLISCDLLG